nr:hypothetical protein CFP56_25977 [Quercus suber]
MTSPPVVKRFGDGNFRYHPSISWSSTTRSSFPGDCSRSVAIAVLYQRLGSTSHKTYIQHNHSHWKSTKATILRTSNSFSSGKNINKTRNRGLITSPIKSQRTLEPDSKMETTARTEKPTTSKEHAVQGPDLPPLSPAEFQLFNHMATMMDQYVIAHDLHDLTTHLPHHRAIPPRLPGARHAADPATDAAPHDRGSAHFPRAGAAHARVPRLRRPDRATPRHPRRARPSAGRAGRHAATAAAPPRGCRAGLDAFTRVHGHPRSGPLDSSGRRGRAARRREYASVLESRGDAAVADVRVVSCERWSVGIRILEFQIFRKSLERSSK